MKVTKSSIPTQLRTNPARLPPEPNQPTPRQMLTNTPRTTQAAPTQPRAKMALGRADTTRCRLWTVSN